MPFRSQLTLHSNVEYPADRAVQVQRGIEVQIDISAGIEGGNSVEHVAHGRIQLDVFPRTITGAQIHSHKRSDATSARRGTTVREATGTVGPNMVDVQEAVNEIDASGGCEGATVPAQRQTGPVPGCAGVTTHSHRPVRAGILVAHSTIEGFFEGREIGPVEACHKGARVQQINLL